MRVLSVGNMYPPHHLGGYELMWRSSVLDLRRRGHRVRVLTTDHRSHDPDPGIPDDPDCHRELHWYWRDHSFPRISLRDRRVLERRNLAVIDRHLDDLRPDVVAWWAMGGMSMSLIERVRRKGIHAVGLVQDDWLVYGPTVDGWQRAFGHNRASAAAAEWLTGIPTRLRLGSAAKWLFVSEIVRTRAEQAGRDLAATGVVHSGIDPSLFRPAPERPWGGRLLYVGRIDPRKGIATAIGALRDLPDARLRVIGNGDETHLAELRRLARVVDDRVSFERMPRARLASAYAEADAVLFPVLWEEPWGLVPLEAMSVGRPVVATGAGGSGEYLKDGVNCLIFSPPDDPRALAGAVRKLAGAAGLRRRLLEGGRKTAGRFTEQAFNEDFAAELAALAR